MRSCNTTVGVVGDDDYNDDDDGSDDGLGLQGVIKAEAT